MRHARMRLYASHVQNAAHHSMRLYAHACIASQMRPTQNVSECNRMSTVQNVIWLVVHAKYAPPNNAHICKQNVWVKNEADAKCMQNAEGRKMQQAWHAVHGECVLMQ